jgi:phage repressor protein C with HTH and peptisase S24 domain
MLVPAFHLLKVLGAIPARVQTSPMVTPARFARCSHREMNVACSMFATDICTIANNQVQNCKSLANDVFGRFAVMQIETDREMIEGLIEHTGLTATQIARQAKLTPSTLTRPLNQEVNFQLSKPSIEKLREAFPKYPPFMTEPDLLTGDTTRSYIQIEVLPSFAGMGGGGTGEGDIEFGMVPRHLVEDELRAKPKDLLLIEARGDSMEPDFHHGDQILIDRRDVNPIQPGSFALWDGDGYVVKLIERIPQKKGWYRIFSSNGRYQSYELEADSVKIMGRPVWFARRL